MGTVTDLLDRPVYGIGQVDSLAGLTSGTARRWIEGYLRGGKSYPPIVREEPTGSELVTWGEFLETRLLSEYRSAGISLVRMRPAVAELRIRFNRRYPLAYAKPFLDVEGKELVQRVQQEVGLERELYLVIVRNGQLVLAPAAERFVHSTDFEPETGVAERVYPFPDDRVVRMDPLRQFGQPVVRSVPTEIIAELFSAGDPVEMIEEAYELSRPEVEAALRFEFTHRTRSEAA